MSFPGAGMNDDTYARLYDLVNARLIASGSRMPCEKAAFLVAAKSPSSVLDVRLLKDADNRTFFESSFLCLLGRLPDSGACEHWKGLIEGLPREKFRKTLLDAILNTSAAKARKARVEGLP